MQDIQLGLSVGTPIRVTFEYSEENNTPDEVYRISEVDITDDEQPYAITVTNEDDESYTEWPYRYEMYIASNIRRRIHDT